MGYGLFSIRESPWLYMVNFNLVLVDERSLCPKRHDLDIRGVLVGNSFKPLFTASETIRILPYNIRTRIYIV